MLQLCHLFLLRADRYPRKLHVLRPLGLHGRFGSALLESEVPADAIDDLNTAAWNVVMSRRMLETFKNWNSSPTSLSGCYTTSLLKMVVARRTLTSYVTPLFLRTLKLLKHAANCILFFSISLSLSLYGRERAHDGTLRLAFLVFVTGTLVVRLATLVGAYNGIRAIVDKRAGNRLVLFRHVVTATTNGGAG